MQPNGPSVCCFICRAGRRSLSPANGQLFIAVLMAGMLCTGISCSDPLRFSLGLHICSAQLKIGAPSNLHWFAHTFRNTSCCTNLSEHVDEVGIAEDDCENSLLENSRSNCRHLLRSQCPHQTSDRLHSNMKDNNSIPTIPSRRHQ